ncbi:MAG: hypothetical protein EP343_26025 [Deltaproteobacteria bacterium]|nr:MAG: hypothetical protein EP343_26025 [Deltaproteobacteria bacterium]
MKRMFVWKKLKTKVQVALFATIIGVGSALLLFWSWSKEDPVLVTEMVTFGGVMVSGVSFAVYELIGRGLAPRKPLPLEESTDEPVAGSVLSEAR